jgi:hypothetical protein
MLSWSDCIAIYAGVVSTIAVAWEVISWLLSQARIEVQISEGRILSTIPITDNKLKIFVKAINKGDKDITLHTFGLESKDGKFLYITDPKLPAKLEARNCHTSWADKEEVLKNNPKIPLIAVVVDAIGKSYRSKATTIDEIVNE